MSTSFATELRARRLSARLSQVELADAARISASAVGAYERGVRKIPHRQTVSMLADALGLIGSEREEFEAAARLTHRFGKRKGWQSLREGLSSGYASLSPTERILFQRFGTIPDAFTVTEACGACSGRDLSEMQTLDALSSLAKNSMISVEETAGRIQYRLHTAARLFAIEKAIEGGGLAANVRALLSWALGKGASPLLAAKVIRQLSLAWISPPERLQFLNWLGAALSGINLDEIPKQDLEACWTILAEGLQDEGEPLRATAAHNCARALAELC